MSLRLMHRLVALAFSFLAVQAMAADPELELTDETPALEATGDPVADAENEIALTLHTASIEQSGVNNVASILQVGTMNQASVYQMGNGMTASIVQSGTNNFAAIIQRQN